MKTELKRSFGLRYLKEERSLCLKIHISLTELQKKKPFYKLDQLETELAHFNSKKYDSLMIKRINANDTAAYDRLMTEIREKPIAVQVQYAPLMRAGFNEEQKLTIRSLPSIFFRSQNL